MKKFLPLVFITFVISSCTFGSKNTDFSTLYQAHLKSQIEQVQSILHPLSSYGVDGSMSIAGSLPSVFSGSFFTLYSTQIAESGRAETALKNIRVQYASLFESGSIQSDEVRTIRAGQDQYFLFSGLSGSTNMIPKELMDILKKYENSWLSIKESDILESLSGSSEEELVSYQVSQALASLRLSDIEYYLKKYPLWKEKNDLGMSGSIHQYEVELAKDNILNLIGEFTEESTSKPMKPEAKEELKKTLDSLSVSGVMGFDPKDTRRAETMLLIKPQSATGAPLRLDISEAKNLLKISAQSEEGNIALQIQQSPEKNTDITLSISAGGKEVGGMKMKITRDGGESVKSIDATFTSKELTVTLTHTNNKDGSFEGKINGGVGNLSWKGKKENETLKELHMAGGALGGMSLIADLIPKEDGVLKGPIKIKSGDTDIFQSELQLFVGKERFFLAGDILSPEDPSIKTHAEIDLRGKISRAKGSVQIPQNAKPFSDLTKEIEELGTLSPSLEDIDIDVPQKSGSGVK